MKLALILNAINPAIGGVLIRGEKGTAKSTAVRGLVALLPPILVAEGCPYPFAISETPNDLWPHQVRNTTSRPAPLVNLPLGVTEDRVLGAIDFERAIQKGEKHFQPGLLAQAHQGVLYIDEVNLLADHVVDVLLDVAATGINLVEREGVSVSHPAKFILVGTMNPEEGELRPQLLDRFGLAVEIAGPQDRTERTTIVKRRLAFERNSAEFQSTHTPADTQLKAQIITAQQRLPDVELADELLDLIADISLAFGVDGMRADIVIYKTARTLAAWEGLKEVSAEHIQQAASLALPHRQRRQPFDDPGIDQQKLDDLVNQFNESQADREPESEPESAESEGD
ncbi:MAG: ATP-binding protein [Candidatus Promineifilaceae bacterium]